MKTLIYIGLFGLTTLLFSCNNPTQEELEIEQSFDPEKTESSKEFKDYWNKGKAEITSYSLEQARYGEIHRGTSVMIFVTEPFSKNLHVKPDNRTKEDMTVMKLNFTKNFTTGIYPYSMMTSSFTPVNYQEEHATKITTTSQEWCGHSYTQLNNRNDKFDVKSYSYFESEGDQLLSFQECWLEDEVWSKIRLNPSLLPIGDVKMVPSFFYIRLRHKETKTYAAKTTITRLNDSLSSYKITYPELDRTLIIDFNNSFPFTIESWEETYESGFGDSAKMLSTKGKKMTRLMSDYWNENGVENTELREQLELD